MLRVIGYVKQIWNRGRASSWAGLGMSVRAVCGGFVNWSIRDVGLNRFGGSRKQIHITIPKLLYIGLVKCFEVVSFFSDDLYTEPGCI